MNRIIAYLQLMRFDRPIGIYLLLWPTWWAVWLAADNHPSLKIIVIFTLGVVVTRAAGCIINDIADRHFDPHVERTKNRPLANGRVTLVEAIVLFIILMLIALILVLQLNRFSLYIAIISVVLIIIYPFCKRFTYLPQIILSIIFNGILMAFSAQQNHLPLLAWLLYFTSIMWTMSYDTMYALTDQDDDAKLGLKSTALLFGKQTRNVILLFQLLFLFGLLMTGICAQLNWVYWLAIIVTTLLSIYQQYLMRKYGDKAGFKAFLNNNWSGLIIFIGIVIGNIG